jgi:hypothetical protein
MSSNTSDETYLEAFVENCLPTLPYQIKRNLDLIQYLDRSCATDCEKLRKLHETYLLQAEAKLLQLQVVEGGVRVLGSSSKNGAVIIPTTDELMDYTYDAKLEPQIEQLQHECLQKADEKVSSAQQALDRVDAIVHRLDEDIAAMEEFVGVQEAAQPNELAACQVTPGSEWILAKVLEHDVKIGVYKLADEDVESHKSEYCLLLYCCSCVEDSSF